jgi:hypothetical protein
MSRESSVGIATGYGLDDRGPRIRFPKGTGNFFFDTMSRPAQGPTRPPTQWVSGAISLEVKRPGRETVHSPLQQEQYQVSSTTFEVPHDVISLIAKLQNS